MFGLKEILVRYLRKRLEINENNAFNGTAPALNINQAPIVHDQKLDNAIGGGGGGGYSTNVYTGRHRPEVQPLTVL